MLLQAIWIFRRKKTNYISLKDLTEEYKRHKQIVLSVIILHTIAMMSFDGKSLEEALWLTATSIETVGYGDIYAESSMAKVSTALLIYLMGIPRLAIMFSMNGEIKRLTYESQLRGDWDFNMNEQISIVGLPAIAGARYIDLLRIELRKHSLFSNKCVSFINESLPFPNGELPKEFREDNFVYSKGSPFKEESLIKGNIDKASHILILCPDPSKENADLVTESLVRKIRSINSTAIIVAETALDSNRNAIKTVGANAVCRSTNDYPGLALQALTSPGSEEIAMDVFQQNGNQLQTYPVEIQNMQWNDALIKLAQAKIGTFMGYTDKNGDVHKTGTVYITDAIELHILSNHSVESEALSSVLS